MISSRQKKKRETEIRRHDEGSPGDLGSMFECGYQRSRFMTESYVANAEI